MGLGPLAPFEKGVAVTPSDSADLSPKPCRGLMATGAGAVSVILKGDVSAVVLSLAVGVVLNVKATRVRATGTTATGIVALY